MSKSNRLLETIKRIKPIPDEKKCMACGETKSSMEFPFAHKGHLGRYCKVCRDNGAAKAAAPCKNRNWKSPWKPGESGNLGGRPKGKFSLVTELNVYLRRHPEEVERIIIGLVREGIAGNVLAAREMMDRVDGKVIDKHEVTGELPIKIMFVPASQILNKKEVEITEGTHIQLPEKV